MDSLDCSGTKVGDGDYRAGATNYMGWTDAQMSGPYYMTGVMNSMDWTISEASGEDHSAGATHSLDDPSTEPGNPNSGRTT